MQPTDRASRLDEVLRMAEAYARTAPVQRVIVITDGNLQERVDFELPFRLEVQRVDQGGKNLGITEMSARRSETADASAWEIFVRVWFFATPIVYSPDILEGRVSGWVEAILRWNPMAVFIRGFRQSFYDGAIVGWAELGAAALAAFLSMTLGWMIFTKMSRRFAEEI